jgi:hypothetical protein
VVFAAARYFTGWLKLSSCILVTRGDSLLDLSDEHVLGRRGEHLTLLGVEVRVVGVDIPPVGRRRGTPGDAELDVVVLEGDEGSAVCQFSQKAKRRG